jgi:hypothetical protein
MFSIKQRKKFKRKSFIIFKIFKLYREDFFNSGSMFRGSPSILSSETFEAESLKTIEIKYKLKNFDIQSENFVSHKILKLMVYYTDKSSLLSKNLVQTLFLRLINSDSENPRWILTKKSHPDSAFVGSDKTEITIVIQKSRKICCFCSCGSILGEQKFELRLPEAINELVFKNIPMNLEILNTRK